MPGRQLAIAAAVATCFAGTALANPVNPQVVHGNASFAQAGNILTVTNAPNTIINWGSFSINAGELTRFVQQSANSAVLNRVIGQDPSAILGALQSNGRVFLINPNGITFGAGAQIDVAGLVASTLRLSNEDFLAGRLRFTDGAIANNVINQGFINSGAVYLVGHAVSNEGLITSPRGEIVLAAGNSVELVSPGTPHLRVEIVAPDNEARNLGTLSAEAGRIGIYAGLIRHEGTARADTAVLENGRIVLKATRQLELGAGSLLSAAAPAGGDGGFIETSAQNVSVAATARVTTQAASGNTGTWLVDPTDFTIAASGGNITGAALSGQLGANNIVLATDAAGGGNGDIFVNDTVTWGNANTLTLNAHRNIDFSGGGLLDGGSSGMIRLNAGLGGSSGGIVAHPSNTVVRGNTLVANALTGIGSLAHPLRTEVQSAAFSNTVTGGIFAANTGNVTVAARSTNGDIGIRTADGANVASGAANRGGNITVASVSGIDGLTTTGSGNISLSGGAGGGTNGSNQFGGDGGRIILNAPMTSAGAATLTGGNGGYGGVDVGFGGDGGSINVNAAVNAAGLMLQAGAGGLGANLTSTGEISTGGAGGDIHIAALVSSTQALQFASGGGGNGSGTGGIPAGEGTASGGNGGTITIDFGVSSSLDLTLTGGLGGNGNFFHFGNAGRGGSILLNASLMSGQVVNVGAGVGGTVRNGYGGWGGAGGNLSSTASGTIHATAAVVITAGLGVNGAASCSFCANSATGSFGGDGGMISLAGTITSGNGVAVTAGNAGQGGQGKSSSVISVAGGLGGTGGAGGGVSLGAISAQGDIQVISGLGAPGGAGGNSLTNSAAGISLGGEGGTGGAGGTVVVNGVLNGAAVSLTAQAGGSGGEGGTSNFLALAPQDSQGGQGGRGGDGGSVVINSTISATGNINVRSGNGRNGRVGGIANYALGTSVGGDGGFGGIGGAIQVNAQLSAGGSASLEAGSGGNGGGGSFSTGPTPSSTNVNGNGRVGGEGGGISLNAAVDAGAHLSIAVGAGGPGGFGASGPYAATGNSGANGPAGNLSGNTLNLQSGGTLSVNTTLPVVTTAARLVAANGLGSALNPLVVNAPSLNLANTAGGVVHVINTGGGIHVEADTSADSIRLHSASAMTLGGKLTATGTGDAIRLSGNQFTNAAGADALLAPNGRWIVWSQTPVNNTFGGLQSGNTALWSTTYNGASPTVAETGNRYAFSLAQPAGQAIVKADDKSKTYGDLFTAGFTFTAFDAGGGASYGNAFTDPGGTVTLTGTPLLASTGAADTATRTGGNGGGAAYDITVDLGGVTAPGFTLQGVSGLLTVNRRNVSVTADAKNLTYGDALQALSFTANNLAAFDNNTTAFTGALSRAAGGTSTAGHENAGTYAIGQGTLAANANYTLTGFTGANYTIGQRALNVTATGQNKVYDGGTTATVTLADNRLGGDSFTVQHGAAFGDKHVGTGKTVNVTGIALSGTDAGNYSANAATSATADITARALDVSFAGVNRSYDATVIATVTTADDRISGDSLVINRGAAFLDKDVGAGKTVNVSGVSLSGADAGNYTVAATGNTTADIVPAVLTVRADDKSRLFNEPNPPLSSTVSGFVGGEGPGVLSGTLTLATTAMDGSLPGNYAITVTPTAFAAPNYTIQFVDGTLRVVPLDPPGGALNNLIVATGKQTLGDGGPADFVFEAPSSAGGSAGCKTVSPGLEICF